jgi:hypothetical protein
MFREFLQGACPQRARKSQSITISSGNERKYGIFVKEKQRDA